MWTVPRGAAAAAVLATLTVTCGCAAGAAGTTAGRNVAAPSLTAAHDPARTPDRATRLCRQAAAPAQVLAAHLTTVQYVRDRKGGPGDYSPAEDRWRSLPPDAAAAWCEIKSGTAYTVGAAGPDGSFVPFMTGKTPIDPGPEGPAIP